MNNNQYIIKMFSLADTIYIDTSALMGPGFHQFITNNNELLLIKGKRIIVKNAVRAELTRHLGSSNDNKVESAMDAVGVLSIYEDLFKADNTPLTDEEIANAFADSELLSELTLHKNCSSQLLIVNDKNLSCDAYKLNKQESCKGGRIFVCYINDFGELHCCACARTEDVPAPVKKATITPVATVQSVPVAAAASMTQKSPVEKTFTKTDSTVAKDEPEEWRFDLKSFGLGVAGAAGIAGLGYGAYRAIKAFTRNNFLLEVVR